MFKERVFVLGLSILAGITLSIGIFYLYQKTKAITRPQPKEQEVNPAAPAFFLNIEAPADEEIFDKNILQLSGKTLPGAQVIVILEDKELALTPGADGSFSANLTLIPGASIVEILAINTNGEILKEQRTLTFTKEEF